MGVVLARWKNRRFDSLRLWLAMLVGASIPILLCWTIPSLLASLREWQLAASTAAAEGEEAAFVAQYADLIALCEAEPGSAVRAEAPESPNLLMVRNGHRSNWQAALPDAWQPTGPDDPSVIVICLGREGSRPVENVCENGTLPDFSETANYEEAWIQYLQSLPGVRLSGETVIKHPEYTGQRLKRYATDVTIYTASGELVEQSTLWGSYPEICTDPLAVDLSVENYLTGDRLTEDSLKLWLAIRFGP